MSTFISTLTPYCTAAQMLTRYDIRTIGKLMSDDPKYIPDYNELVDKTTKAGGNLNTILMDASGDVELAALKGGRYTVLDLQGLIGANQSSLQRIVADLAVMMCYQRRPTTNEPIPTQAQIAMNKLADLESGGKTFGIQEAINNSHLQFTTDWPSDVVTRNGMVVQAQEFFGRRANRNLPRYN